MKKGLFLTVFAGAAIFVAACGGNEVLNLPEAIAELNEKANAAYSDSTLTSESQRDAAYYAVYEETYKAHKKDSLGLYAFTELVRCAWDIETVRAELASASDLLVNDEKVVRYAGLREKDAATSVGTQYIDIEGVDAIDGSPRSLSQYISEGKPVLVDFWASWCGPCRRAIKNHLVDFYAENSDKYNIVGIAVWEDSADDTRNAMTELGVSWPVIYSGGRENSPTDIYGVTGIPTLMVVSADGTILYKGYDAEQALATLAK